MRRRLSLRERRILAGVGLLTAALIVAIVISLIAAGKTSSHGCIYVTIPAVTGAEQISQCGDTARATCRSTSTPGAFAPEAARDVAAACRKAGLPVSR
jgi:predicted acylesterase/phospholipase RssA